MGFLRRLSGTGGAIANPRPDLLRRVAYQHLTSEQGLPMVDLRLHYQRNAPAVANPEMSLAVLLDRSGSMTETFRDGHVYNATSAILDYVNSTGSGFDLAFYDSEPAYAGHVSSHAELRAALEQHAPRGYGTYVTAALQGVIQRYHRKRGIYIIVVTDGEFADKTQVQQLVVERLLPQLSPQNPYAFRLHFIGAGEEVDREFLEQLERAASGQGIQLVKQHHHAHLRHSHDSMLDELDGAYLGPGLDMVLAEAGEGTTIRRAGDLTTHRWFDGPRPDLGFVPHRSQIGIELNPGHPAALDAVLRYRNSYGDVEIPLHIPLPHDATQSTPAATAAVQQKQSRFHLPWHHATPEGDEAKAMAEQQRAELAQRVQQVRVAEQQRQAADMRSLGQGGIPSMARERLQQLRGADPEHATFTSDLSPDEAALLRRNGYRALGLVTGSAMYHVGTAYASAWNDCEVTVLSQAYNEATRLAVSRMQQEAHAMGATGVVGVRFDMLRREWSAKSIEVTLVGTAVAGPDAQGREPWLSDLSGQEWWALHRAGYDPAGFVYGHCTWFILTTQMDEWTESRWGGGNQELGHFSDALRQCRNRANGMVQQMARQMRAVGVVGVHLSRHLEEIRLSGPGENPAYEREHHNLTLSLIGTAVRLRPDAPQTIRATGNVLSLRDGRITPTIIRTTEATFE